MKTLLLILLSIAPAQQAWKYVAETDANRYFRYDAEITNTAARRAVQLERQAPRSDTDEGAEAHAETVRLLRGLVGEKAETFSFKVYAREYKCATGEARTNRVAYFDNDDAMLYELARADVERAKLDRWQKVEAGTVKAALMKAACATLPKD